MFAGITSTTFEKEGDVITGMVSREGENVKFSNNVTISEDPIIYIWLGKIESGMQISLAHKLQQSIDEMSTIDL